VGQGLMSVFAKHSSSCVHVRSLLWKCGTFWCGKMYDGSLVRARVMRVCAMSWSPPTAGRGGGGAKTDFGGVFGGNF